MRGPGRDYTWGPSFTENGTRFRLWAPDESRVALTLGGKSRSMTPTDDGWFEVLVEGQPIASSYGFVLRDGSIVPDPASRHQSDILGLSQLVDPDSYGWKNVHWKGRDWREAVVYEVHIGTFTTDGTFRAAAERLAYLAEIGFTAIEMSIGSQC